MGNLQHVTVGSAFLVGIKKGVWDLSLLATLALFTPQLLAGQAWQPLASRPPVIEALFWEDLSHLPYGMIISEMARRDRYSPLILASVVTIESGFDPNALSEAGAMGLAQIMPTIARAYGASDPFDPVQNLSAASRFLAHLLEKYAEDQALAIAAYHAGEPIIDACRCISRAVDTEYVRRWNAAMDLYSRHYQATTHAPRPGAAPVSDGEDAGQFVFPYRSGYVVTNRACHFGGWGNAQYGVDISNGPQHGTPLYAPITGAVTHVGRDLWGNTVVHFQNSRFEVAMLHGDYSPAYPGMAVIAGVTHVGYEASIGRSSGVHTHLSIFKDGQRFNPLTGRRCT